MTVINGYKIEPCADLRCANLRGAQLGYTNLRDADLRYTNLKDADLREADLKGANLKGANLRYANLSCADLSCTNLREADLRYANLRYAIGDGTHIRTMQTKRYTVVCTEDTIAIGCQKHSVKEWEEFSDAQIITMDGIDALEWWNKYKDIVITLARDWSGRHRK